MVTNPGLAKYQERQRNLKRLKELKRQLHKFEVAFKDEGNNDKMDDFCMKGMKQLRAEITELTTRV